MKKSEGLTPTEAYLATLGKKSFLSLWSHPNLYRDTAKELADLTVVCGHHVVLFSDKHVKFDLEKDIKISWPRWYNRAVIHSTRQLIRAHGWVTKHRDRIFSDAKCSQQSDLFKGVDQPLEIHLVAVANGAANACLRFFAGGSGSLVVCPDESPVLPEPFCVGNPGGSKAFVHVFDEANLNVILQELDTIGDFLSYLRARQKVFSDPRLVSAHSEEDILALYLRDVNAQGEHDFMFDEPSDKDVEQFFIIQEGYYFEYRKRPEYRRKKLADKVSYFWDNLIESFANNLSEGTLVEVPKELPGFDGRDGSAEIGLRYMALEPRILRRAHSEAILGAFESLKKARGDRFFRAMLPPPGSTDKTGFFVLLVNRRSALREWPYDEYRRYRALAAHAYSENLLFRNRELKRVVGIATEGELGKGRSEDLIYQEQIEWDEDAIAQKEELAGAFDIFQKDTERRYSTEEYPKSDLGLRGKFDPIPYQFFQARNAQPERSLSGNRTQRRKQLAKNRRSEKKKR